MRGWGGQSRRAVACNEERGSMFTEVKWGSNGEWEKKIKKRRMGEWEGAFQWRSRHGAAVCLKGRMVIFFFSCLIDSRVLINLHVCTVLVCVDKKSMLMASSNTHIPSPWCILTHMHTCPHPNLILPTNLISGVPHTSHRLTLELSVTSVHPLPLLFTLHLLRDPVWILLPSHAASLKVAPKRSRESWKALSIPSTTLQTHSGSMCEGLARVKCLHACVSLG